jgi:hypothetical protein
MEGAAVDAAAQAAGVAKAPSGGRPASIQACRELAASSVEPTRSANTIVAIFRSPPMLLMR